MQVGADGHQRAKCQTLARRVFLHVLVYPVEVRGHFRDGCTAIPLSQGRDKAVARIDQGFLQRLVIRPGHESLQDR